MRPPTTPLSPRELDALRLAAQGKTSKEIAAMLGIGARTVDWHLARAAGKLGAENRTEAAVLALERGLLR